MGGRGGRDVVSDANEADMFAAGPEAQAIGDQIDRITLDAEPGWEAKVNALMDELAEIEEREMGE